MKRISQIAGGLLIIAIGYIIYEVAKVAPAAKIVGPVIGAIVVVGIITGFIYGMANLASTREKAITLFKPFMLAFEILLLVVALIGSIKAHQIVPQILGFMNQKQISTVSDEAAVQETWQPNFTSVGNLDPVQGADIANQVAGNVSAINFSSGQEVAQGQLLVQLDDSNERAQLQGFQAQEKLAELNAQRAHDLFAKKLVSQSDVDTADNNLQQARANVANTQADISEKTIRAPFSGHAGIRNVNLGQYLPVGTVIVTLQSLDHMYVSFALPEQALPLLAPQQKVDLTVDTYPNQHFTGAVNAIDSKVDPASHNIRIQAMIDNPKRLLRAGMFANVTVSSGKPLQVVTVPKASVTYSLYGNSVFIITPDKDKKGDDGKPVLNADEVFVKLGDERGTRVAVLEGVKPGDMVVTTGMQKLHKGSTVAIDNSVTPDQNPGEAGK